MKKLLVLVILLALGFNGFSGVPQTAREILSRPVFAQVEFEDVGIKAAIRDLARRPECSELSLSYGFAPDLRDVSLILNFRQKNLFQILNFICIQNKLRFSFKDNFLYFSNDTGKYRHSQTTTGNSVIDAKLSEIIFPDIQFTDLNYISALNFLTRKAGDFTFIWEADEDHANRYKVNYSSTGVSLFFMIQEICKQANLQFRYAEDILVFSKIDDVALAKKEFNMGKEFYSKKDYESALSHFTLAAVGGHAEASYILGLMNLRGEGIPKSETEAYIFIHEAAQRNHVLAQYSLGLMYDKGEGVEKSPVEAMKWFRKAADQGDPDAQYLLSFGYGKGEGVEKDYDEAVRLLLLSASQDHEGARMMLKKLEISTVTLTDSKQRKFVLDKNRYNEYVIDRSRASRAGKGEEFGKNLDGSKYLLPKGNKAGRWQRPEPTRKELEEIAKNLIGSQRFFDSRYRDDNGPLQIRGISLIEKNVEVKKSPGVTATVYKVMAVVGRKPVMYEYKLIIRSNGVDEIGLVQATRTSENRFKL